MQPGWGNDFWPQASIEVALPFIMGYDNGNGVYLNLGVAGTLEERLIYGLELQVGRVRQTGPGEPLKSGSVSSLRASFGIRF
ncbi:MAG: hypothetical protein AD742_10410 [Methylibium sp. NZG]|nr:MAG: hypothetical protein AD742_10410 [Methylibium sp. NZG]